MVLHAQRPSRADVTIAALVMVITMAGSVALDAHLTGGFTLSAHMPVNRGARQEQARRRAGEERLRIAQDLHDMLAHQLALITVQANAGLALLKNHQPGRASESLMAIKEAGNSALGELRWVLNALRMPDGVPARRPAPMLSRAADLTQLTDGARAAGLAVDVRSTGPPRPLPVPAGQAAYRIVQEALTNTVRHGGPGTRVAIRLDFQDTVLRIEVADDGRGSPPAAAPPGGRSGPLGQMLSTGGFCDERIYLFLARERVPVPRALEPD